MNHAARKAINTLGYPPYRRQRRRAVGTEGVDRFCEEGSFSLFVWVAAKRYPWVGRGKPQLALRLLGLATYAQLDGAFFEKNQSCFRGGFQNVTVRATRKLFSTLLFHLRRDRGNTAFTALCSMRRRAQNEQKEGN